MANTTKKQTNIYTKLAGIQKELKVPKDQLNKFGGYKYRNAEDIQEAVKPLLDGLALVVSDRVLSIDGRFYIEAIAELSDGNESVVVTASAREPENRKGMDESQITGATSSYARKYALNGLFAIDDNKDPDTTNTGDDKPSKKVNAKQSKMDLLRTQFKEIKKSEDLKALKEFQERSKVYYTDGLITEPEYKKINEVALNLEQDFIFNNLENENKTDTN